MKNTTKPVSKKYLDQLTDFGRKYKWKKKEVKDEKDKRDT